MDTVLMRRRGNLLIVSSPSGAGKTTLARRLLHEFPEVGFSVSYTTREARAGEREGSDYVFVSTEEFDRMVERDEFAEYAIVHGNRYGTARAVVEGALAVGRDVVFDVDWQGGRALRAHWPGDAVTIFILPPDLGVLDARLRQRATDADEVIRRRLAVAIEELGHHVEYQHRVVNDDLSRAYATLRAIYLCRRDGRSRHPELTVLVDESEGPRPRALADGLIAAARVRQGARAD